MLNCDDEMRACSLPESSDEAASPMLVPMAVATVRYIGDPICSGCWVLRND